jgi:hypothetical protein
MTVGHLPGLEDLLIGTLLAVAALATYASAVATGTLLAGKLLPPPRRRTLFRLHRAAAAGAVILAGAHVSTVAVGAFGRGAGTGAAVVLGGAALAGIVLAAASWVHRRRLGRAGAGAAGPGLQPPWQRAHVLADAGLAAAFAHVVLVHPPGMPRPEAVGYAVGAGIVVWLILCRVRARAAGRRGNATGPFRRQGGRPVS